MKKIFSVLFILGLFSFVGIPAIADEVVVADDKAEVVEVAPDQSSKNEKGFLGVNYNRQDSKKTGKQRIVNDHSFFNININIIKEGALFKMKDAEL